MLVRLNKYLSECGVASRRHADRMIVEGRVRVNGQQVKELGAKCDPATDQVEVDGRSIKAPASFTYAVYNKPRGVTTTAYDRHAEKTLRDALPRSYRHLRPAGRLDKWSEGLLLLTNHGELIQRLTHPKYKQPKTYLVEANGPLRKRALNRLERGVKLGKELARADEVKAGKEFKDSFTFELVISEGKKRQVRRMCETVDLKVRRLRRIGFGPLTLGKLASGHCRSLKPTELKRLLKAAQLEPPKSNASGKTKKS